MSAADYPPGTVAVATVDGVERVRVMKKDYYDHWSVGSGGPTRRTGELTDIRPLVVLDPKDPDVVRFLQLHNPPSSGRTAGAAMSVAQQIREQTKPPRIPEPGIGGVVRAGLTGLPDVEPKHRVRLPQGWANLEATGDVVNTWEWEDLIDPVLIREGVES